MPASLRAAVAGFDLLTAVCATINLAYFWYRLSARPPETAARRTAALVLAIVSLGAIVESVALLALSSGGRNLGAESAEWALVRGLALAGTAGMSALVVRRLVSR